MDYIINPIWFYLMSVADGLNSIAIIVMVVSLFAFVAAGIVWFVTCDEYEDIANCAKKASKAMLIICAVCAGIVIFVPSRETLCQILFARMATYSNIQTLGGMTKDAFDYIIQSIQNMLTNIS